MTKKRLGAVLCLGGGLMLTAAAGRYAQGAVKADAARQAWDEAKAREAVAVARSVALNHGKRLPVVSGAAVARIVIPRVELDAIVIEGVDEDALNAGPGHLTGSAYPGEPGNAVISAHRDRHFNRLGAVEVGDTVITESGTYQTRWVVVAKRVVDKDAPALFRTKDATLTLTTCWPIRYFGAAPERLIVTAKPVRAKQPSASGIPASAALD